MTQTDRAVTGIMTAMAEEMEALSPLLQDATEITHGGVKLVSARMGQHRVEIAQCGIGKVNAAIASTLLLERGAVGLIFTGCAGGLDPELKIGDVVLANRVIQHDYGALTGGELTRFQPGMPPLPGFPTDHGWDAPEGLIRQAQAHLEGVALDPVPAELSDDHKDHIPRLLTGTVLTGDIFLNCEATRQRLHAETQGHAIEMEGAAMAQVAVSYGRPWVILRALSDLAGAESSLDFPAFARYAARNAAKVTAALVEGQIFAHASMQPQAKGDAG
ncbi:MAG: 5'-methylthioadenosine/adenosylhomocysteine nucleosidase [Alphaproteobacteria bacterium]